jgi:hypothetical protein
MYSELSFAVLQVVVSWNCECSRHLHQTQMISLYAFELWAAVSAIAWATREPDRRNKKELFRQGVGMFGEYPGRYHCPIHLPPLLP